MKKSLLRLKEWFKWFKQGRSIFLLGVLIIIIFGGVWIAKTPGLRPIVISVYKPPILWVEHPSVDIGLVDTDSHAQAQFFLYNIGGKHLRLTAIEPSCGCTLAEASKKVIPPGGFSQLKIDLDTSLKLGAVRKSITVRSNDPTQPVIDLVVTGEVLAKKAAAHDDIMLQPKDRLALFKGRCATCHVNRGVGKTGKALFLADCAMCHGQQAEGNGTAGPALRHLDFSQPAIKQAVHRVIANGSPHTPQMPPFSQEVGGPLTDDEIESLVQFLAYQSQAGSQ
ncbi:MAG: DUF1573 domain-containing protein [Cyanobacteria bacterium P01_H01_bin.74]